MRHFQHAVNYLLILLIKLSERLLEPLPLASDETGPQACRGSCSLRDSRRVAQPPPPRAAGTLPRAQRLRSPTGRRDEDPSAAGTEGCPPAERRLGLLPRLPPVFKEKTISLSYRAVNKPLGILFYAAHSGALHATRSTRRELCDVLFNRPKDGSCEIYLGMYLLLAALLSRAFSKGKGVGQAEPLGNVNAESTEAFSARAAALGEVCEATSALARPSSGFGQVKLILRH